MADIKKYSLIEKLKSADEELDRSPSLLGMTMLTYPNYINAMRSTMFTGHLKQFLNLLQPQFPLVFTNNENTVGNQSNGYYKAPNDMVVYKRVNKFENLTDKPFVYSLFLYDTVKEEYDVKERKVCEDLTEISVSSMITESSIVYRKVTRLKLEQLFSRVHHMMMT